MAIGAHRKVVTVLFCDVVGSTELGESVDPEALQGLLARYFERMKGIVESHGGSVEKFIGDAVMAVFGVPVSHEDDALRACRAAVEMRDALPGLGVEGRIGVNTGEVLTGTEERLATGDAVNVAARLEQAAQRGEVLIGAETLALVGGAVDVGEGRSLELKGKSAPVGSYPLFSVRDATDRSHASRFVGRERELEQLVNGWDRARAGSICALVTVVGDPGVGKSRLVAEALARIDARVVRGRCLSYGEGITYWPVVEVVKQLDELPRDDGAAGAIRSLLGEGDIVSSTDEIAWAFRKLLEEQAPLIVCFDDIQWGEETFLDLVESTSLLSTGAPLLLICMARPELLDRRPGWPAILRLEPLPPEEAEAIVGDAVPSEIRERIVLASGGNPLFVTEMLALSHDGGSDVEVPPTLRALLAARLDQLDEPERRVLELGAVEGELFHRGTVQALAPEETDVTPRLAALVRRQLVRPDRPQIPREDAYRFRHLLIRDAAYDALPKATRADLHRRFAEWLEEHGQTIVELDEILGYHLEQAARYLDELGKPDRELAIAAADHLATAGRHAVWRADRAGAGALLERSLALTRPYRLDIYRELDPAWAREKDDVTTSAAIAIGVAERAELAEDGDAALVARAAAAFYQGKFGEASLGELERLATAALPRLQAVDDHRGLIIVWLARDNVANWHGHWADRAEAAEEAIRHSRLAGEQPRYADSFSNALVGGPQPASEALRRLERVIPDSEDPVVLGNRARLLAMLDRFDEAWTLLGTMEQRLRDFGRPAEARMRLAEVALLDGDQERAAADYRAWCQWEESTGYWGELSVYFPRLACILCGLGIQDEAEQFAEQGRELADPADVVAQVCWREAKALVCSARREHGEAEQFAREAVQLAETTDLLQTQGEAWSDLAEVLDGSGRPGDAVAAYQEALDRYERKEIIPLARCVRERLAAIQPTEA